MMFVFLLLTAFISVYDEHRIHLVFNFKFCSFFERMIFILHIIYFKYINLRSSHSQYQSMTNDRFYYHFIFVLYSFSLSIFHLLLFKVQFFSLLFYFYLVIFCYITLMRNKNQIWKKKKFNRQKIFNMNSKSKFKVKEKEQANKKKIKSAIVT